MSPEEIELFERLCDALENIEKHLKKITTCIDSGHGSQEPHWRKAF